MKKTNVVWCCLSEVPRAVKLTGGGRSVFRGLRVELGGRGNMGFLFHDHDILVLDCMSSNVSIPLMLYARNDYK